MTAPLPPPFDAALHRILVVDDEEIVLVALRETLRRLAAHLAYEGPRVLVIADDGSDDGTAEMLAAFFDLKQVNPDALVSVKLVAQAGIGTIASGVAKAMGLNVTTDLPDIFYDLVRCFRHAGGEDPSVLFIPR